MPLVLELLVSNLKWLENNNYLYLALLNNNIYNWSNNFSNYNTKTNS